MIEKMIKLLIKYQIKNLIQKMNIMELIQKILKEERALKLFIVIIFMILLIQLKKTQNYSKFSINRILLQNIMLMNQIELRQRLQQFKQHLMDEQDLSLQCQTHFYQKQHQN
ncbi:unnamed protein product [Paramecium sonneborni]|uniref:Uncharacterized protein n=1 Tax=Paramecium sonneborni TaxID=65129 RepID=A0A8S1PJT6_9CILI|nr:unnamed protein product [Paramecium sonneborni]